MLLIQLLLAVIEHLRYFFNLRCLPKRGRFHSSPLDCTPPHVTNSEAVPWHDTPQTTLYGRFKVVLMVCSGLAPLRLLQGLIFFSLGCISLNICNIVPLRLWKKIWLYIVKLQIYGVLWSMGYYKIPITGTFASPQKVKLLMGNHVCLIEVLGKYSKRRSSSCNYR